MIESNNEKTFICVSFYTADEKCEYEKYFHNLKPRSNCFNPGHWDNISKTRTLGVFVNRGVHRVLKQGLIPHIF